MARRSAGTNATATTLRSASPSFTNASYPLRASPVTNFLDNIVDDARLWHPDPEHGALTIGNRWANVVVHKRPLIARTKPYWSYKGFPIGVQVPVGVQFESPLRVVRCVRRKMRRGVIFALRRNKQGSGARRHKMHWHSKVWC